MRATSIVLLLCATAVFIAAFRYEEYVIRRNFTVTASVPCESGYKSCFVYVCGGDNTECDPTPYAKVTLPAVSAPACLFEHTCESFSCTAGNSCTVTPCSPDTVAPEEYCTSPTVTPEE